MPPGSPRSPVELCFTIEFGDAHAPLFWNNLLNTVIHYEPIPRVKLYAKCKIILAILIDILNRGTLHKALETDAISIYIDPTPDNQRKNVLYRMAPITGQDIQSAPTAASREGYWCQLTVQQQAEWIMRPDDCARNEFLYALLQSDRKRELTQPMAKWKIGKPLEQIREEE